MSDRHYFYDNISNMWRSLTIPRSDYRFFLLVFVIIILAHAQVLFEFTYASDDYGIINNGLPKALVLSQGRYGVLAIEHIFDVFGISLIRAPLFSVVISSFLATWVGYKTFKLLGGPLDILVGVPIVVILMAHPYTAEVFNFRVMTIWYYISLAMCVAALLSANLNFVSIALNSALIFIGLTIYQVPINFILIVLIFIYALHIINNLKEKQSPSIRAILFIDKSFLAKIIVFIFGFSLYVVMFKIITAHSSVDPRSQIIHLQEMPDRIVVALQKLYAHFVTSRAYAGVIVPRALLFVPILCFCAAIVEILFHFKKNRLFAAGVVLVAACASAVGVLGILLLSERMWLPPRVLTPIGVVWAGAALLALSVRQSIPYRLYATLFWFTVAIFVAKHQEIHVDHYRVNVRNHIQAQEILARLHDNPEFTKVQRVISIGGSWAFKMPITTAAGNQNTSIWVAPWAVAPMLSELSGVPIGQPTQSDDKIAKSYCKSVPAWPAPASTTIIGDLAIVCLN